MYPILFTWGDSALYTYTTMLSLAIIVGTWLWVREAHRLIPLASVDSLINAVLAMFLLGFLGARLTFVATNLQHYRSGLFVLTSLASGGIVFYGGFVGGVIALYFWARLNDHSLRATFNSLAPGLAIGHAIGRLGCLAHGCCYGSICTLPWGISYHDPRSLARPLGTALHPTQIYEILGLIAIGAICLAQNRKPSPRSRAFKYYLLSYGTLRFFVEFFRGDSLRGAWAGLSTSQWVSIGLIISCLFLDFAGPKSHNSAHENRT